jgi:DNA-binding IclR family transcriptional regulator
MADDLFDWDALLVRLLHETQLQVIEAMRWIDGRLSASELAKVLDEAAVGSSIYYHVRHLSELGVLRQSGKPKRVRGSIQTFYRLSSP